jgi:hypothetical protein
VLHLTDLCKCNEDSFGAECIRVPSTPIVILKMGQPVWLVDLLNPNDANSLCVVKGSVTGLDFDSDDDGAPDEVEVELGTEGKFMYSKYMIDTSKGAATKRFKTCCQWNKINKSIESDDGESNEKNSNSFLLMREAKMAANKLAMHSFIPEPLIPVRQPAPAALPRPTTLRPVMEGTRKSSRNQVPRTELNSN